MSYSRFATKTVLFIFALSTTTGSEIVSAAPINLSFNQVFSATNSITLIKNISRNNNSGNKDKLGNNLYNQNVGFDPAGWLLAGPALDASASALARPYYESYGYHSVPRNYIYYDWGW
jgi:hypothetical protein